MRRVVPALLLSWACGNTSTEVSTGPAKAETPPPTAEASAAPGAGDRPAPPSAGGRPALPANHPSLSTAPRSEPRDVTPSGKTRTETVDELTFSVPEEWEQRPLRSTMRKATLALPGPGGDAEFVVYRFKGGAGSVDANLERWKGQMSGATNESTRELDPNGLHVTVLSVDGTYVGSVRPGSAERHDQADSRMIAAVIEGSGDPLFVKLVGARKTIDLWNEAVLASLGSFAKSSGDPG